MGRNKRRELNNALAFTRMEGFRVTEQISRTVPTRSEVKSLSRI